MTYCIKTGRTGRSGFRLGQFDARTGRGKVGDVRLLDLIDVERAEGVGDLVVLPERLLHIVRMGEKHPALVVDRAGKRDADVQKNVVVGGAADDVVDEQFARVKQSLIGKIAADPADGEYALDLLMIAKYYERIGDHATNIAEWVIYSVTGTHKDEITLT